ncbi:MAG: TlyA family RNA methyltransferase [Firmicutes bacterium]|nr:TlyA family RNA methyltransferase [Bacillota bacterium]
MKEKERLDILLVERGLHKSREQARRSIMAGEVRVDGGRIDKPGTRIPVDCEIEVARPAVEYVSRGGIKLEAALREFDVSVKDKVAIDIGASTGGFTDCLIKHGARRVYAVDVGYGQLAWELRQDPRVVNIERTNIRYLDAARVPEKADIITIDVSFISIRKFLPRLKEFLAPNGRIISLIKPQFEAGREQVGKKGVVRDPQVHRKTLSDIIDFVASNSFHIKGLTFSPIKGPEGNIEYFLHLGLEPGEASSRPGEVEVGPDVDVDEVVRRAHAALNGDPAR